MRAAAPVRVVSVLASFSVSVLVSFLVAVLPSATVLHAQRGAPEGTWPAYGGDAGSTKYAPLDQINAENVDQLQVVWRWTTSDAAVLSDTDSSV